MAFSLDKVVPWGRNLKEYIAMFSLSHDDLQTKILGCSDGPASFNAQVSAIGGHVVSVDPLYQFSAPDIARRIDETFTDVIAQTRDNCNQFIWKDISSIEHLADIRATTMKAFIENFKIERGLGRYVCGSLPNLPFADRQFELALCSHFLFLYSELFDAQFHIQSLLELSRVATEVRVFPILELNGKPSRHLEHCLKYFEASPYQLSVQDVDYEFQKGGRQMLRLNR